MPTLVEIYSVGLPRLSVSTATRARADKIVADWRAGKELTIPIANGEVLYLNGKLIASIKIHP